MLAISLVRHDSFSISMQILFAWVQSIEWRNWNAQSFRESLWRSLDSSGVPSFGIYGMRVGMCESPRRCVSCFDPSMYEDTMEDTSNPPGIHYGSTLLP